MAAYPQAFSAVQWIGAIYLAWLGLDGFGDVSTEFGGVLIAELAAIGDDADFAAGLDGVGLIDAGGEPIK